MKQPDLMLMFIYIKNQRNIKTMTISVNLFSLKVEIRNKYFHFILDLRLRSVIIIDP
jgi:hypothetical protein